MLDDDQRVPLSRSAVERVEQSQVVTRMQTNGRFVEDVKNTAKIPAELRGEANSLASPPLNVLGRTPKREIIKPDIFHEMKRCEFPGRVRPRSLAACREGSFGMARASLAEGR